MQKFDFNDILIEPYPFTTINSRYEDISIKYSDGTLPLFTAPMDTVVDSSNYDEFYSRNINVCLPRTEKQVINDCFYSIGLKDEIPENVTKILIDVANGHMKSVFDKCEEIKKKNENIIVMAGNIANPSTFHMYGRSGVVDLVRIGIGNGGGCLTTQQTGVGYPMASLVRECRDIKSESGYQIKIIADGGMKTYSDIIKALALGADYVMLGSMFNKALESCAITQYEQIAVINTKDTAVIDKLIPSIHSDSPFKSIPEYKWSEDKEILTKVYNEFSDCLTLKKVFRGMSTKEVQKSLGNSKVKTSEGVTRTVNVEYTLDGWLSNFEHYLRSAMSYTESRRLEEFIGEVGYNLITSHAYHRFNK